MIIDCHTHWNGSADLEAATAASGWLQILHLHGVTGAVVLPTLGLFDASRLAEDNDRVAAICAASGGHMIPFCTVNPWWGQRAVAEFRRCLETLGHRGLKIHPWLQGVSPNCGEMDPLCELAGEKNVPVLWHDGTPCFSLPSQIALLAERHPNTTFVLGHFGLFEHWREAIAAINHTPNLWGCLCGPHVAALKEIVCGCDLQRLVWGSDYGFSSVDVVGYRLELLDHLNLNSRQKDAILGDNPQRLFASKSIVPTTSF